MTPPAAALCRLGFHAWRYTWRRYRGRHVIGLLRTCQHCGTRQCWRIDTRKVGEEPEFVPI